MFYVFTTTFSRDFDLASFFLLQPNEDKNNSEQGHGQAQGGS